MKKEINRILNFWFKECNAKDRFKKDGCFDNQIKNYFGDVRDEKNLRNAIIKFKPDIIFHLAAHPLVIEGYKNPYQTFKSNCFDVKSHECCMFFLESTKTPSKSNKTSFFLYLKFKLFIFLLFVM